MSGLIRLFAVAWVLLAAPVFAQAYRHVIVVGDSQSQGVFGARPLHWEQLNTLWAGTKSTATGAVSIGGRRCDQLLTEVFRPLVVSATGQTFGITGVVIQCGVNDMIAGWTSAQTCGTAETPGPLRQMVAEARAKGLPVIIVNVAPWGGNGSWTSAKQTQTVALNSCIAGLAATGTSTLGPVVVVDVYTAFGQTAPNGQLLRADLDDVSGPDGLHYDSDAGAIIAAAINAAGIF